MKKIKVYLASPYSMGDTAVNVHRQIEAANKLYDAGFTVFVPLLSHFQHLIFPRKYEFWLENDLEWLPGCDCILRLSGESLGADVEENEARILNMKIFYDIDELIDYYENFD